VPTFVHKRTGRVLEVSDRDAPRYRNGRFEEVSGSSQVGGIEVPEGTVVEILDWAGDDPDRRAAALAAERSGKRRKGLLSSLGG
jgi:hypothetical protein